MDVSLTDAFIPHASVWVFCLISYNDAEDTEDTAADDVNTEDTSSDDTSSDDTDSLPSERH